jgi:hypothetical protein
MTIRATFIGSCGRALSVILHDVGVDISGFIEIRAWVTRPDEPSAVGWEAAIPLDCLYTSRSYDAFGCLFGVKNFAGFRPVAAERGLPADVSAQVREHVAALEPVAALWPTWVSWPEIQAVDWDEPAEHADARLHRYERVDGLWKAAGKASWSPDVFEAQGIPAPPPGTYPAIWPEGSEWTDGDVQFRAERLTRRDAVRVGDAWQPVWEAMGLLARLHGDQHCRLVVWFDR